MEQECGGNPRRLSPKLVGRLAELFPHSLHVFDTGLARYTSDEMIWEYAGQRVHYCNRRFRFPRSRQVPRRAAQGGPPGEVQLPDIQG